MCERGVTESVVESAALAWLASLRWAVGHVLGCGLNAALRDALLPKLISGELRVRDAERFVDGVDSIDSMGEVDGGGA
jgi:hypothetical protein